MKREELAQFDLPDEPGIYMFRGLKREILYIGKATSLKDRVRSYFARELEEARSPAIVKMVEEAHSVSWHETSSVLEALILEANLIKQHQPPFNTASKDNKSFNYLVVTNEPFPRLLVIRGRELYQKWEESQILHLFGPFPQGSALQEGLKIVRKIFPFRDAKCTPCTEQKRTPCKPCFNGQIGLCPGVCTGEVTAQEYGETIGYIAEMFSGNFGGLKQSLENEMRRLAKEEKFEQADRVRRQIVALEHIKDVSLIRHERISAGGGVRVEAFDVAHTAGAETVGVMVVVDNGEAYRQAYRKFKISSDKNNDVAALTEIVERRLAHNEWPLPRVFVVDGSIAQLRAVQRVLTTAGVQVPIVGVVKNERHRPERLIGDPKAIEAFERDILLANAEAHRFAISWHRKRLQKRLRA